jgi:hypothetical protein
MYRIQEVFCKISLTETIFYFIDSCSNYAVVMNVVSSVQNLLLKPNLILLRICKQAPCCSMNVDFSFTCISVNWQLSV